MATILKLLGTKGVDCSGIRSCGACLREGAEASGKGYGYPCGM